MADSTSGSETGMPRWVKVQGVVLLLLVLVVIAMPAGLLSPALLGFEGGGHGGHGGAEGHAPPAGGQR